MTRCSIFESHGTGACEDSMQGLKVDSSRRRRRRSSMATVATRMMALKTLCIVFGLLKYAGLATGETSFSTHVPYTNPFQVEVGEEIYISDLSLRRLQEAKPWEARVNVWASVDHGGLLLRCRDNLVPVVGSSTFTSLARWNHSLAISGKFEHVNLALSCLFYRAAEDFEGSDPISLRINFGDTQENSTINLQVAAPADYADRPIFSLAVSRIHTGVVEDTTEPFQFGALLEPRIKTPLGGRMTVEAISISGGSLVATGATTGLTSIEAERVISSLTYTPAKNYFGEDVIQVNLTNEASGLHSLRFVILHVEPENDPPEINIDTELITSTALHFRVNQATVVGRYQTRDLLSIVDVDSYRGEEFRFGIRAPPEAVRFSWLSGVTIDTINNTMGSDDTETIVQGRLEALNALLRGLILTPPSGPTLSIWLWAEDGLHARSNLQKLTFQVDVSSLDVSLSYASHAPMSFHMNEGETLRLSSLQMVIQTHNSEDSVHIQISATPGTGTFDLVEGEQLPYWLRREGLQTSNISLHGSIEDINEGIQRLHFVTALGWNSVKFTSTATIEVIAKIEEETPRSSLFAQVFVMPSIDPPSLDFLFLPINQNISTSLQLDGAPMQIPLQCKFSIAGVSHAEAVLTIPVEACANIELATFPTGLYQTYRSDVEMKILIIQGDLERVKDALTKLIIVPMRLDECDAMNSGSAESFFDLQGYVRQGEHVSDVLHLRVRMSPPSLRIFLVSTSSILSVSSSTAPNMDNASLTLSPNVLQLQTYPEDPDPVVLRQQQYTLWLQARLGELTTSRTPTDVVTISSDNGRSLVIKTSSFATLQAVLANTLYTPYADVSGLEEILAELHIVKNGEASSRRVSEAYIPVKVDADEDTIRLSWVPVSNELVELSRIDQGWNMLASLQGLSLSTRRPLSDRITMRFEPLSSRYEVKYAGFRIVPSARHGLAQNPNTHAVHGTLEDVVFALEENLLMANVSIASSKLPLRMSFSLTLIVSEFDSEENVIASLPLIFSNVDLPPGHKRLLPITILLDGFAEPFANLIANPLRMDAEEGTQVSLQLPLLHVQAWDESQAGHLRLQALYGSLLIEEQEGSMPQNTLDKFETVSSLNAWLAQGLYYFPPSPDFEGEDIIDLAISGKDGKNLYTTRIPVFVGSFVLGVSPELSQRADTAKLTKSQDIIQITYDANSQADSFPVFQLAGLKITEGTVRTTYEIKIEVSEGSVSFPYKAGLAIDQSGLFLRGYRDKLNDALERAQYWPDLSLASEDIKIFIELTRVAAHSSMHNSVDLAVAAKIPPSTRFSNNPAFLEWSLLGTFQRKDETTSYLRGMEGSTLSFTDLGWEYVTTAESEFNVIELYIVASQGRVQVRGEVDSSIHRAIPSGSIAGTLQYQQVARDVQSLLAQIEIVLPNQWNSETSGSPCLLTVTLAESSQNIRSQPLVIPIHVIPTPSEPQLSGNLALNANSKIVSAKNLRLEGWKGYTVGQLLDLSFNVTGGDLQAPTKTSYLAIPDLRLLHSNLQAIRILVSGLNQDILLNVLITDHDDGSLICQNSFTFSQVQATAQAVIRVYDRALYVPKSQQTKLQNVTLMFESEMPSIVLALHLEVYQGELSFNASNNAHTRCEQRKNDRLLRCVGSSEAIVSFLESEVYYYPKNNFHGIDTLMISVYTTSFHGAEDGRVLTEANIPLLVENSVSSPKLDFPPLIEEINDVYLDSAFRNGKEPLIPIPVHLEDLSGQSPFVRIRLRQEGDNLRGKWEINHLAYQALITVADDTSESPEARYLMLEGSFRKIQKVLGSYLVYRLDTPMNTGAQSATLFVDAWFHSESVDPLPSLTAQQALSISSLQDLYKDRSGCFVGFSLGCQGLWRQGQPKLNETGISFAWSSWFTQPKRSTAEISVAVSGEGAIKIVVPDELLEVSSVKWTLDSSGTTLQLTAASLALAEQWVQLLTLSQNDPLSYIVERPQLSISARLAAELSTNPTIATCYLPPIAMKEESGFSVSIESEGLYIGSSDVQAVLPQIAVSTTGSRVVSGFTPVLAFLQGPENMRVVIHPADVARLGLVVSRSSELGSITLQASTLWALNEALGSCVIQRRSSVPWNGTARVSLTLDYMHVFDNILTVTVEPISLVFWETTGQPGVLNLPTLASDSRVSYRLHQGQQIKFEGLSIASGFYLPDSSLRSILVQTSSSHGLWLQDAEGILQGAVKGGTSASEDSILIILEPSSKNDSSTVFESQLLNMTCDIDFETHIISTSDAVSSDNLSGTFQVTWNGQVTQQLNHNISSDEMSTALQALTGSDYLLVSREANSDSLAGESFIWSVTFADALSGPTGLEFGILDAIFSSSSVEVQAQQIQSMNVLGGSFRLNIFDQTTDLIPYDVTPEDLQDAISNIAPCLLFNGVSVTLADSITWNQRIFRIQFNILGHFPLLGADIASLEGDGAAISVAREQVGSDRPWALFQLVHNGMSSSLLSSRSGMIEFAQALEQIGLTDYVITQSGHPDGDMFNGFVWSVRSASAINLEIRTLASSDKDLWITSTTKSIELQARNDRSMNLLLSALRLCPDGYRVPGRSSLSFSVVKDPRPTISGQSGELLIDLFANTTGSLVGSKASCSLQDLDDLISVEGLFPTFGNLLEHQMLRLTCAPQQKQYHLRITSSLGHLYVPGHLRVAVIEGKAAIVSPTTPAFQTSGAANLTMLGSPAMLEEALQQVGYSISNKESVNFAQATPQVTHLQLSTQRSATANANNPSVYVLQTICTSGIVSGTFNLQVSIEILDTQKRVQGLVSVMTATLDSQASEEDVASALLNLTEWPEGETVEVKRASEANAQLTWTWEITVVHTAAANGRITNIETKNESFVSSNLQVQPSAIIWGMPSTMTSEVTVSCLGGRIEFNAVATAEEVQLAFPFMVVVTGGLGSFFIRRDILGASLPELSCSSDDSSIIIHETIYSESRPLCRDTIHFEISDPHSGNILLIRQISVDSIASVSELTEAYLGVFSLFPLLHLRDDGNYTAVQLSGFILESSTKDNFPVPLFCEIESAANAEVYFLSPSGDKLQTLTATSFATAKASVGKELWYNPASLSGESDTVTLRCKLELNSNGELAYQEAFVDLFVSHDFVSFWIVNAPDSLSLQPGDLWSFADQISVNNSSTEAVELTIQAQYGSIAGSEVIAALSTTMQGLRRLRFSLAADRSRIDLYGFGTDINFALKELSYFAARKGETNSDIIEIILDGMLQAVIRVNIHPQNGILLNADCEFSNGCIVSLEEDTTAWVASVSGLYVNEDAISQCGDIPLSFQAVSTRGALFSGYISDIEQGGSTGMGVLSWSADSTKTSIRAGLDALLYTPKEDWNGQDLISIIYTCGTQRSRLDITVMVKPVEDLLSLETKLTSQINIGNADTKVGYFTVVDPDQIGHTCDMNIKMSATVLYGTIGIEDINGCASGGGDAMLKATNQSLQLRGCATRLNAALHTLFYKGPKVPPIDLQDVLTVTVERVTADARPAMSSVTASIVLKLPITTAERFPSLERRVLSTIDDFLPRSTVEAALGSELKIAEYLIVKGALLPQSKEVAAGALLTISTKVGTLRVNADRLSRGRSVRIALVSDTQITLQVSAELEAFQAALAAVSYLAIPSAQSLHKWLPREKHWDVVTLSVRPIIHSAHSDLNDMYSVSVPIKLWVPQELILPDFRIFGKGFDSERGTIAQGESFEIAIAQIDSLEKLANLLDVSAEDVELRIVNQPAVGHFEILAQACYFIRCELSSDQTEVVLRGSFQHIFEYLLPENGYLKFVAPTSGALGTISVLATLLHISSELYKQSTFQLDMIQTNFHESCILDSLELYTDTWLQTIALEKPAGIGIVLQNRVELSRDAVVTASLEVIKGKAALIPPSDIGSDVETQWSSSEMVVFRSTPTRVSEILRLTQIFAGNNQERNDSEDLLFAELRVKISATNCSRSLVQGTLFYFEGKFANIASTNDTLSVSLNAPGEDVLVYSQEAFLLNSYVSLESLGRDYQTKDFPYVVKISSSANRGRFHINGICGDAVGAVSQAHEIRLAAKQSELLIACFQKVQYVAPLIEGIDIISITDGLHNVTLPVLVLPSRTPYIIESRSTHSMAEIEEEHLDSLDFSSIFGSLSLYTDGSILIGEKSLYLDIHPDRKGARIFWSSEKSPKEYAVEVSTIPETNILRVRGSLQDIENVIQTQGLIFYSKPKETWCGKDRVRMSIDGIPVQMFALDIVCHGPEYLPRWNYSDSLESLYGAEGVFLNLSNAKLSVVDRASETHGCDSEAWMVRVTVTASIPGSVEDIAFTLWNHTPGVFTSFGRRVELIGCYENVNVAIGQLRYKPPVGFAGEMILQFGVGRISSLDADQGTYSVRVQVQASDNGPRILYFPPNYALRVQEGESIMIGNLVIRDTNAERRDRDAYILTVYFSAGTLQIGPDEGLNLITNYEKNSIQLRGLITDINHVLRDIVYIAPLQYSDEVRIEAVVSDSIGHSSRVLTEVLVEGAEATLSFIEGNRTLIAGNNYLSHPLLVTKPESDISLENVYSLSQDLGTTTFAELKITASAGGAIPEIQQISIRRSTFLDVQVVRVTATLGAISAPATFVLSYDGESTTAIDRMALDAASKEIGDSLGESIESKLTALSTVDRVEVSRIQYGDYDSREWVITFFRQEPGPLLILESENDPGNAVEISIERLESSDEMVLSGSFVLSYAGRTTVPLLFSAHAAELERALSHIPIIDLVKVNSIFPSNDDEVFAAWEVTFIRPGGDIPLLKSRILNSSVAGTSVKMEVIEVQKGFGLAPVQRVTTKAEHKNQVIALRTTATSGPLAGTFQLSLDLTSLGGQKAVSTTIDHAAVASISEEIVHASHGARPGESLESILNNMLRNAARGVENSIREFHYAQMFVTVSRTDQICDYTCQLHQSDYSAPLCSVNATCDMCIGKCADGMVKRCYDDDECESGICEFGHGECLSTGEKCNAHSDCIGTGVCSTFDCRANVEGGYTWIIEFHNAPANLPMLEISSSKLYADESPDVFIGLLQSRKNAPEFIVPANSISGFLLFDGTAIEYATNMALSNSRLLVIEKLPDLETGIELYLIDLGRQDLGLEFPVSVSGINLEGDGVSLETSMVYSVPRLRNSVETPVLLKHGPSGASVLEELSSNSLRVQGTIRELNAFLKQPNGIRLQSSLNWYGQVVVTFDAVALGSTTSPVTKKVLVNLLSPTPVLGFRLERTISVLREDLVSRVFTLMPAFSSSEINSESIQFSLTGDDELPVSLQVTTTNKHRIWIDPVNRLLHRSVSSSEASPQWSKNNQANIVFNGTLSEVRVALQNLRFQPQALGIAELALQLKVDERCWSNMAVSLPKPITRLIQIQVKPIDTPLDFVNHTRSRTVNIEEGETKLLLQGLALIHPEANDLIVVSLEVQRGLLEIQLDSSSWTTGSIIQLSEDKKSLYIESSRSSFNDQIFPHVFYKSRHEHYTGVDAGVLTATNKATRRSVSITLLMNISSTLDNLQVRVKSPHVPLDINEDEPLPLFDVFTIEDVDIREENEYQNGNITLILETQALHVDLQQAIHTSAEDGLITGYFKVSIDLRAWGGSLVVSDRISVDAVASITEERTTYTPGTDRGESMESKVNKMLSFAQLNSTLVDPITVSVTRSNIVCNYGCKSIPTTYDETNLECSQNSHCDLCVGYCDSGSVYRCSSDDECAGSCVFSSGECLSDGSPCTNQNACRKTGICEQSNCTESLVGGLTWIVTFHKAPWDFPLLDVSEVALSGATNARVDNDIIPARSPALAVQPPNELGGSFHVNGHELPFNASATEVHEVFEKLRNELLLRNSTFHGPEARKIPIDMGPLEVSRSSPSLEHGYIWSIQMSIVALRFASALFVDGAQLLGTGAQVSINVHPDIDVSSYPTALLQLKSSHGVMGYPSTGLSGSFREIEMTLLDSRSIGPFLSQLYFFPDQNWNSNSNKAFAAITLGVSKLNDTEMSLVSATQYICVQPVNDAPVLIIPGAILDPANLTDDQQSGRIKSITPFEVREGTLTSFHGVSIRDVDAGKNMLQVEILAVNGSVSLGADVALEVLDINASRLTMLGSLSAINYALEQLQFQSSNMYGKGGNSSIFLRALDVGHNGQIHTVGDDLSDSVTIPIRVSPNDAPPVLELPEDANAWYSVEDEGMVLPGVHIDFLNYDPSDEITFIASAAFGSINTPLTFDHVSIQSNSTSGDLRVGGTVAAVNTVLKALLYEPESNFNSKDYGGPDSLQFTVSSNRGDVVQQTASIYIDAVNDPPFIFVPEATVTYDGVGRNTTVATPILETNEDVPFILPNVQIHDADGALEVIHVTFMCTYCAFSLMDAMASSSIEVHKGAHNLTLHGQLSRVNAALGGHLGTGLIFTPLRDWFGTDTIWIYTEDEFGSSDSVSQTVIVHSVNDAPIWVLPDPLSLQVDEDGAIALSPVRVLDQDASLDDPVLVFIEPAYGSVSVRRESPTRRITLNNTLRLVNADLATLMYFPATQTHSMDDAVEGETITFIADDLGNRGLGGTQVTENSIAIDNIVPWSDRPRLLVPGAVFANSTTCQESTRISLPRRVEDNSLFDICGTIIDVIPLVGLEDEDLWVEGVQVEDKDYDISLSPRRLAVHLYVTSGVIQVRPHGALDIMYENNGRAIRLQGSPSEINDILSAILYKPDKHWFGQDHLSITVEDSSYREVAVKGGVSLRDQQSVPLFITPVQDVPQFTGSLLKRFGGAATLTSLEDTPLLLAGPHQGLSVEHPDGESWEIVFIAVAQHGSFSLDPKGVAEVQYIAELTRAPGSATKKEIDVFAFQASVGTVKEAISHIVYIPELNWHGIDDITMLVANSGDLLLNQSSSMDPFLAFVSEQIHQATGHNGVDVIEERYSSATFHVDVYSINDSPTISLLSGYDGTWLSHEDESVLLEGLMVDDADNDTLTVKISVDHGVVEIYDLGIIANQLFVEASKDSYSLQLRGPMSDIQSVFGLSPFVAYIPDSNWNGVDTLSVVVIDDSGNTVSWTGQIVVSSVNDPPEIVPTRPLGASSVFHAKEGEMVHLAGPARLQGSPGASVPEYVLEPTAGIWRSLVVRPGRTAADDPSWRYSIASNASEPQDLIIIDDMMILFSAEDTEHGRELWRSDGLADDGFASTNLVKDLRPGEDDSDLGDFHLHDDGLVYFAANGKDWTWRLETDSCNGFRNSYEGIWLAVSESTVFDKYGSYDCPTGYHWASTDELAAVVGPATERTRLRSGELGDYYASECGWNFTTWEGAERLRFMLADSYLTSVFLDARQEAGSPGQIAPEVILGESLKESSFAGIICMANGDDGSPCMRSQGCFKDAGKELWVTDGSADGTKRVLDIYPGPDSSDPAYITSFDGSIFFSARSETYGRELWRSDGTVSGTRMVSDINLGIASSSPQYLTVTADGSALFFSAEDAWHGSELWVSDGVASFTGARPTIDRLSGSEYSATGTHIVLDIRIGDQVGSEPSELVALIENYIAFVANDGVNGRQIWLSDGSELGTGRLTSIRSSDPENGCNPKNLIVYNKQLYFTAEDGIHGRELWRVGDSSEGWTAERSDGTQFSIGTGDSVGAKMVADLKPGSAGSEPSHLYVYSPTGTMNSSLEGVPLLVFDAMDALWIVNGIDTGTPYRAFETTAKDLRFTDADYVELHGALYFAARPPQDIVMPRSGMAPRSDNQPFYLRDVDGNTEDVYKLSMQASLGTLNFQDGAIASAGVSGTLEFLNEQLRGLYYQNSDGKNGADILIVSLEDADGATTTETFDIDVSPANTVPSISLSKSQHTVSLSGEDIVPLHISVTLADEEEILDATLEVSVLSSAGQVLLEPLNGITFKGKGEHSITVQSNKSLLNQVLSEMHYKIDRHVTSTAPFSATVILTVRDLVSAGSGVPRESSATILLNFIE